MMWLLSSLIPATAQLYAFERRISLASCHLVSVITEKVCVALPVFLVTADCALD